MKSLRKWMSDLLKDDPEKREKNLKKQYRSISDWAFRELSELSISGVNVDSVKIKSTVKRYVKTWFKDEYKPEHYDNVLGIVYDKINKIGLNESFQSGGSRSIRTKEEETEIAKQSPIYQKTQYQGWKIHASIHAAAQAYDRRPGFEFSDWKDLHRKAIRALKGKKSGDFIVYSKSMEQGYVFSADAKSRLMRVITVLPRGRKNPKPGTDVLLVECGIFKDISLIEVE